MHIQKRLLQRLQTIEQRIVSHRQITLELYIQTIEVIMMSEKRTAQNLSKAVPILDVTNYTASMGYYVQQLGFRKNWDWDGFGSVSRDNVEIFLSLNPEGKLGTSMTVFVKDVASLHREFIDRNASIIMEPKKMKWGVIELRVEDLDGHMIRFTQILPAEETVVQRTEIKARVEQRLAAVIEDLARETGRNVGELIEEVFLHSFEPVQGQEGQASASPHTLETYDLIFKLKEKHNMNYDTHDNYGFID
jgi:hypothetical protein